MAIMQMLTVAFLLLLLLGGALWMARRAAGHDGDASPPLLSASADLVADDPHVRHQTRLVEQATTRSATIHSDATRLAEFRMDALDATIGAQQAQRTRERENDARLELLGVNRQILEERLAAEIQERRRAGMGGDHAGTG